MERVLAEHCRTCSEAREDSDRALRTWSAMKVQQVGLMLIGCIRGLAEDGGLGDSSALIILYIDLYGK